MRQVKKEDAIKEYGVRYVTALEALDLNMHREATPDNPRDALAQKLEKLSKQSFDGTIRLVEELGAPTKEYHYKNLADVNLRYEFEKREQYQRNFKELGDAMTDPANERLLERAAESQRPEQQRLKAAFEKAYEKFVHLEAFLSSGLSFKVGTKWLPDNITLPDTIANAGDTVFVVQDDGKSLPSLSTATVGERDFGASFFSKADFSVSYEINTGNAAPARDENKFFSVDASEAKAPAGVVAKGLNQLAFNSKAAAVAHIGNTLDARETGLKAELKQVRSARKKLGNNAP